MQRYKAGVASSVFLIGLPYRSGLRPVLDYDPRQLSRYTRAKRLTSGTISFYWSIPTWAKRQGCTLAPKALGPDRAQAVIEAQALNRAFDDWRRSHQKLKAMLIPTGNEWKNLHPVKQARRA